MSDNTHLRTFSTAEQLYLFLSKLIQTQDDLIKLATGLRLTKEQITPPKDETKRAVNSAAYRTLSDWNELTADLEDQVKVNTLKQSFSEMQLAHKIENVDLSICTKKISHWSLQPKPKQMQHHRRPFME